MSLEMNKRLVERFYDDVWNRGVFDTADDVFDPNYVRHDLRPGSAPPGPEGQKAVARLFRAGFPDVRLAVDFMVADEDFVMARWNITGTHRGEWAGIKSTNRAVSFAGVNIFRFAGGKVVEIWNHRDDMGLAQQLGAPVSAGTPERPGA